MNKNKGITLVALVITIIILLILAGITIAQLTGSGLFENARLAEEKSKKAEMTESLTLALQELQLEKRGKATLDDVTQEWVNSKLTEYKNTVTEDTENNSKTITMEKDGITVNYILDEKLKLTESTALTKIASIVGKAAINKNQIVVDEYGNKIVIPAGFIVVAHNETGNDSTEVIYNYTGNTDSPAVQDGIVITDEVDENGNSIGNEFVWIPVGRINNKQGDANGITTEIILGRYTFGDDGKETLIQKATNWDINNDDTLIESRFQEYEQNDSYGNTKAKDLEEFVTKTNKNGGYYIARYEASYRDGGTRPYSKVSKGTPVTSIPSTYTEGQLWNFISQLDAATVSKSMYTSSYFKSDLVNSYAWDTAIVFIQAYSGDTNYSKQSSKNNTLANTGVNEDKVCNIHDMASNLGEWTTETNIDERISSYSQRRWLLQQ